MAYARINDELVEAPEGATCWKYADPTEGARWVYDVADRKEIEREDPSLIEEVSEMVYCHGCGDDVLGSEAHWSNGEPYCVGCHQLDADEPAE